MKKVIVVACVLLCVLCAACSSGPKVARVDANTQVDLSGRWNDSDVRQVCSTLIESAVNSNRIDAYIRDFQSRNGRGVLPTVIVGNFRNTSSEHIDTKIISTMMQTAIINSGKLEFVEGGKARDEIRAEKTDQQFNASEGTASAIGAEIGANFMLQGEVNSMEEKSGNTTVRAYFVKASITNIETGQIIWQDQNSDIKKVIVRSKAKL